MPVMMYLIHLPIIFRDCILDILKRIEGAAFTIMDIHLKETLNNEVEESDSIISITLMPENIVRFVCEDLDSDIYELVRMNDEQLESGMSFVAAIIEKDRTNVVSDAMANLGALVNPIGAQVKQTMREALNDDPIYIELRNLYAGFGMDLVLGVFDELIQRGSSPEDVYSSVEGFAVELGYAEQLIEEVDYNIEFGIACGGSQKTEAKVAEVITGAGGAIAGAKIGAIIGSIVPGPGTIAGAAAGGVLGNKFSKKYGNKLGQEHDEKIAVAVDYAKETKKKVFDLFK
jgi:hypothetical protein